MLLSLRMMMIIIRPDDGRCCHCVSTVQRTIHPRDEFRWAPVSGDNDHDDDGRWRSVDDQKRTFKRIFESSDYWDFFSLQDFSESPFPNHWTNNNNKFWTKKPSAWPFFVTSVVSRWFRMRWEAWTTHFVAKGRTGRVMGQDILLLFLLLCASYQGQEVLEILGCPGERQEEHHHHQTMMGWCQVM